MSGVDTRVANEVDQEIGARMRARRQELGVTQSYVADLIGLTTQQMQKYESGENRVAVGTLLRIAEVLRTEPNSLLPGTKARRSAGPKSMRESGQDPLSAQLLAAFMRIQSPSDKRLVLTLARKFAGDDRTAQKRRARPAKQKS